MIDFKECRHKYNIIYADPPWHYRLWNTSNYTFRKRSKGPIRMASAFYDVMQTDEICSLPIEKIADKNCALILWVTNPLLPDGLRVMRAWGFEYKTIFFVWVKLNPNSSKLKLGLGNFTRPNSEIALLGMKGTLPKQNRGIRQVHKSAVRRHSEKPAIFRDLVCKVFGYDLPKIELFARHKPVGWDTFGNEIPSEIPLEKYSILSYNNG